MRQPRIVFAGLVLSLWAFAALSADGFRVTDGDTIQHGGTSYRILNIDAPEIGQTCTDSRGRSFRCGEDAANFLKRVLAGGRLTCEGRERDAYDRVLAKCSVDGRDVGAEMVAAGMAAAFTRYSNEYLPLQVDAFKAGRGLWAGSFQMPWEFRQARWDAASKGAPRPDCPIKGNINAKGERIYHTPYSRHYDRTRINTRNGERWFCDEAEAQAAGWRAPIW